MDVNIIGSPATNLVQLSPGAAASPPQTSIATPAPAPAPAPAAAGIGTSGAGSASAQSTSAAPPTLKQVKQAVDNINASLNENGNGNGQGVQFAIDPTSKHIVVQVLDPESGKVIRQIPTEEIIQMGMDLGKKLGQVIQDQA